jgi:hypothetical protein
MQRANLNQILARQAYDHAVICTFTFEPRFFEEYCLDQLNALEQNNNITVILDRRIYDGLMLAPPPEWPRQANIRYLLHPVDVPGIFHPKLFLFANKDKGLLILGSANFTKAGLTRNAELVGVCRYERGKNEQHLSLFQQAIQFLGLIAQKWPSSELEANLQNLVNSTGWLAMNNEEVGSVRLVHNLYRPLWDQVADGLGTIDEVHVLSRYFDVQPSLLTHLLDSVRPKKVVLWTENGTTTMTPSWFDHPGVRNRQVSIRTLRVLDDQYQQPLHAKAIAFVQGKEMRLAFGSANFTTSGLLSSNANVETMIISGGLPLGGFHPKSLFDPSATSKEMRKASELTTALLEPPPQRLARRPIELHEANLSDSILKCRYTAPDSMPVNAQFVAVLTSIDGGEIQVHIPQRDKLLIANADESIEKFCSQGTTLVQIKARFDKQEMASNHVFLINLKDIESGRNRHRERRIREAQKSAEQFAAMLTELLQLGETDALKTFLTYCDIPVINAGRAYSFRGSRSQWLPGETGLVSVERHLRIYASLHDAAIGFCERHLARMKRHCGHPTTAGVANFMHITLAISTVMKAQTERALIGLENLMMPLTVTEWYEHRRRIEEYLKMFRSVIDILNDGYLPALQKRFNVSAIRDAIYPDLEPLTATCTDFLHVRDRIDACRRGVLRVRGANGQVGPAPVFNHDLLSPSRWEPWAVGIRRCIERNQAWSIAA